MVLQLPTSSTVCFAACLSSLKLSKHEGRQILKPGFFPPIVTSARVFPCFVVSLFIWPTPSNRGLKPHCTVLNAGQPFAFPACVDTCLELFGGKVSFLGWDHSLSNVLKQPSTYPTCGEDFTTVLAFLQHPSQCFPSKNQMLVQAAQPAEKWSSSLPAQSVAPCPVRLQ